MSSESRTIGDLTDRYMLSLDHQIALRSARGRLGDQFADVFNIETIERFIAGSYDQFAHASRVPHYVHILAERFARQRLIAFSQVEGHLDAARHIVLFVCPRNDLYSPMARGLFERRAGKTALAWSAGVRPGVALSPHVEPLMSSVGVDMSEEFPKPIASEMVGAATVVVTFGCEHDVPQMPGRQYFAVPAPDFDVTDRAALLRLHRWLDDGMAQLHAFLFPDNAPAAAASHQMATYAP